jgi:hypothetical protein
MRAVGWRQKAFQSGFCHLDVISVDFDSRVRWSSGHDRLHSIRKKVRTSVEDDDVLKWYWHRPYATQTKLGALVIIFDARANAEHFLWVRAQNLKIML